MNVLVLGAGFVGSAVVTDLSNNSNLSVTVIDLSQNSLDKLSANNNIKTVQGDCRNLSFLIGQFNGIQLVVNAVPGFLGFNTLNAAIESGCNVADVAFYPEDPYQLNALAKKLNIAAVVDAGFAPGISSLAAGCLFNEFDSIKELKIFAGGLPKNPVPPFNYKAFFSPVDVIEEFIRPARLMENGKIVEKPAMSDLEQINFPEVGELEAFNTDGLRTLLRTLKIADMSEKTLRYPGHVALMSFLKEVGYLSPEQISIGDRLISPLEVTTEVLISNWQLEAGEQDLSVLRVIASGVKENKEATVQYDLLDHYDTSTNITSMARTTGFTTSITALAIAEGLITDSGVLTLEELGQNPSIFEFYENELIKRNIKLTRTEGS